MKRQEKQQHEEQQIEMLQEDVVKWVAEWKEKPIQMKLEKECTIKDIQQETVSN
jgi:hypothetical protein